MPPPPNDQRTGFKPDPLSDGEFQRWWSGEAWGDATKPEGGPTLSGNVPVTDRPVSAPVTAPTPSGQSVSPGALLGIGFALQILGVLVLGATAASLDPQPLGFFLGWLIFTVGGMALLVSLIAYGVAIGMKHASDLPRGQN